MWTADLVGNFADVFSSSTGVQAFDLAIPVAPTPVLIGGPALSSGERNYVISQDITDPSGVACNLSPTTASVNGEADGIESSSLTLSSTPPGRLVPGLRRTDRGQQAILRPEPGKRHDNGD